MTGNSVDYTNVQDIVSINTDEDAKFAATEMADPISL